MRLDHVALRSSDALRAHLITTVEADKD